MKKGISNTVDTILILQALERERQLDALSQRGAGVLYNSRVTCTGFMGANPNDQITYAVENGLIAGDFE